MSGRAPFTRSFSHYGSARAALEALPDLARRGGAARPGHVCSHQEAGAGDRGRARGRRGVPGASASPNTRPRLKAIADPPPLLAVRGHLPALLRPMVAIVGSRNASAAGAKIAERLARELGAAGFVIASGLARGIDAAAHRGSLETGTLAVLAGGHDRIYPEEHIGLLERHAAHRRRALRNAVRLGAAGARLSPPQSPDLRRRARRRRGGGGRALRLAHHGARSRSNRGARCSRCPARRSIRAPRGRTTS